MKRFTDEQIRETAEKNLWCYGADVVEMSLEGTPIVRDGEAAFVPAYILVQQEDIENEGGGDCPDSAEF